MEDKELLELAAKAAGYEVFGLASRWICQGVSEHALLIRNDRGGDSIFDSLNDDGDALRLAVKLGLDLEFRKDNDKQLYLVRAFLPKLPDDVHFRCTERLSDHGEDGNAAIRKAITRAAAEIGKGGE